MRRLLVVAFLAVAGPVFAAGRPFALPPIDRETSAGGSFGENPITLDASGEKVAYVVRVWQSGTINKIRFRTATVTTGDTLKLCLEDVAGASGDPDEVCDQFRTHVVADANDNVGHLTGIVSSDGTDSGTKRTVTAGDLLAIVVEFDSYVAGNLNISNRNANSPSAGLSTAYATHKTGGTWTKSSSVLPRFALEYSDGSYYEIPGVDPYTETSSAGVLVETFNSASTPDERGNIVTVPYAATAVGIWIGFDPDNDCDLVLYEGTTAQRTVSIDSNIRRLVTPDGYVVPFSSGFSLTSGSSYRVVVKPGASNVSIYQGTTASAAHMDAAPGGQSIHATSRTDAGSFSETTTKRYLMGLVVTVDPASGGVSAARVPNGM